MTEKTSADDSIGGTQRTQDIKLYQYKTLNGP